MRGVRLQILSGFLAVLFIMACLAIYNYKSMRDIASDVNTLKYVIGKQAQIVSDVELTVKEIQEDFTDAIVRSEERIGQEVRDDLDRIKSLIEEFVKVEEAQDVKNEIRSYIPLMEEYFQTGEKMLMAFVKSRAEGEAMMDLFDQKADKVLTYFENLKKDHIKELNTRYDDMEEDTNRNIMVSIVANLLATTLGLALALIVSGMIAKKLLKIAESLQISSTQVADASSELSSASQSLSGASSQQASSIEETSSSLEELTGMVSSNVENANQCVGLAESVRDSADKGNTSMNELIHSMEEILSSTDKIQDLVKVIGEIGEKTAVIDEIVFQTKLLSFNASVEAERAGEHGRGFAVVAQEVGNLAQMSGKAATEISRIVKESIKSAEDITIENKNKVLHGNTLVKETATILSGITSDAKTVYESTQGILSASKDQSSGINQINSAVSQMDKVIQDNASTAEEAASSSEELNSQAVTLKNIVQELNEIVTGKVSHKSSEGVMHFQVPKQPLSVSPQMTAKTLTSLDQNVIVKTKSPSGVSHDADDWDSI